MTQKTALYDLHLEQKARMVNFAGWEMPIQYSNIKEEILAVRTKSGVFDVSHMGEFLFTGKEARQALNYILTNDLISLPIGKALYSPLCDEDGKILDDAIAYLIGEEEILLCVNASNIDQDRQWIQSILTSKQFDCQFEDQSPLYSLLALQGPDSEEELEKALHISLSDIPYYGVKNKQGFTIARTGYTGEDGFEIFASHESIRNLWKTLLSQGVAPCGLGARDVLRLEASYPLYGQDLLPTLTPFDCNLKWTVKLHKQDFIGKETLNKYNPQTRLIKLTTEKGIPRNGQKVYQGEELIGEVSSGTFSPTLQKGICLALVKKEIFNKEEIHFLEIRGKKYQAQFTNRPFISGGHK